MKTAVEMVMEGSSLRSVAARFNLSFQTLARYVSKQKSHPGKLIRMTPNYAVNKIFSEEEEASLATYLLTCAKMFYGLPTIECRNLAYEMAITNNVKIPDTWRTNQQAGIEWLRGFLRRHPNLSLLIYDNHESHLSLPVLDLAKQNGVTILTLPPHSTNKLQPLDVGVFKPFNMAYDAAVDSWMLQHPGKTTSIYEVAACVGIAHGKAFTPRNITSALKKCGIFPFDQLVFTEIDFLPSSVADRPQPAVDFEKEQQLIVPTPQSPETLLDTFHNPGSSSSSPAPNSKCQNFDGSPPCNNSSFVTPERIRGYPKSKENRSSNRRTKGRSMIATDTPEKKKKLKKGKASLQYQGKNQKRVLFHDEESSEGNEDDEHIPIEQLVDDSSSDGLEDLQIDSDLLENLDKTPQIGGYVLTEFIKEGTGKCIFYIGKILSDKDTDGDFGISFLRKSKHGKCGKFTFPDVPDLASVSETEIKMILPSPKLSGKTKRQQSFFSFELDFSLIDIR